MSLVHIPTFVVRETIHQYSCQNYIVLKYSITYTSV